MTRVHHHRRTWKQFVMVIGPGVVSGAADNDPSGVITYIQIGATTGFSLLWLMLLSTPILYYLEEMSTRVGAVAKRGMTRVLRARYGPTAAALIVLPLVATNALTIGADLAGTAAGAQLLTGISWEWWIAPITAVIGYTLVFASYRTLSRFLLVLTPLFLLYVVTGFVVHPDWHQVLRATLVPSVRFTPTFFEAALGLLGATLTPYMFLWQTTETVEARLTVRELRAENVDVAAGMTYANLVFYFIILVAAAGLYGRETGVQTVAQAATALTPLVGPAATTLFAVGIVASGFLSVPVMAACSAYALAELLGWREGLNRKVGDARGFYVLLSVSLLVGAATPLLRISPVTLMFWSQVVNGFLLAPLFIVLLMLANDPRVVRAHRNGLAPNLVGWGTVLLTLALAVLTVRQLVVGG
ncbi:MAG TPA: divalent metal cation transporter [bacterium]|nr:divalent metal cation transporter [bacterium]